LALASALKFVDVLTRIVVSSSIGTVKSLETKVSSAKTVGVVYANAHASNVNAIIMARNEVCRSRGLHIGTATM